MSSGSAHRRPDYHRAARTAYQVLLAAGDRELPVNMLALLDRCKHTQVLSYTQAARQYGESVYSLVNKWPSHHAFTVRETGDDGGARYMVFYNDDVCFGNQASRRWSLAHELGHILLGHAAQACPPDEMEANCFTQHLLCPRPLLEALPGPDLDMLCVAFGLSRAAAAIALRSAGGRSIYVDEDMRQGILSLYGIAPGADWPHILHPIQRAAYNARRRREDKGGF